MESEGKFLPLSLENLARHWDAMVMNSGDRNKEVWVLLIVVLRRFT